MIYSVVIHFFNLKHRFLKRSGFSKVKAHAFVTTDIDNQATRLKAGLLLFQYNPDGFLNNLSASSPRALCSKVFAMSDQREPTMVRRLVV